MTLIIFNLLLLDLYLKEKAEKIYLLLGTYQNAVGLPDDFASFVFDEENHFNYYEGNALIDEGTWKLTDQNVYIIKSNKINTMINTMDDVFYSYECNWDKAVRFKRFSLTPIYFE